MTQADAISGVAARSPGQVQIQMAQLCRAIVETIARRFDTFLGTSILLSGPRL